MQRVGVRVLLSSMIATVVVLSGVVPAAAATSAGGIGPTGRTSHAGVGALESTGVVGAVPAKKTKRARTKVVGWKAARKSTAPATTLRAIKVTGPANRLVKVQKRNKKASGRWRTAAKLRTDADGVVDVSVAARELGYWRLKVPATKGWRKKTTARLRITKKKLAARRTAEPVTVPKGNVAAEALRAGAVLPVSYNLAAVGGRKYYVAVSGNDSAAGSTSSPLRTVAKAIAKVPSGGSATIIVRGGTYREGQLTIPAGRAIDIRAYPGETPTFLGSRSISSGWTKEGSLVHHSYTPQPVTDASGMSFTSGQGLAGDGSGKYPDQAWVGSTQLRQVASKSALVPGTFWVDRGGRRIYLHGSDAAKGGVEVSRLDVFLTVQGADSLVEGLRVSRFSNSADDYGVIKLLGSADRTVLRDIVISEAAFQALMLAGEETTAGILHGVVLERVTISRANWMGISSNMVEDLVMRSLRIVDLNSFREFTSAPQSGAFKASRNRKVKFIGGVVANSNGHGLWFDQSSYDVEVAGSRITGVSGSSVFFEISDGLLLINNYIRSSGERAVKLAGASGLVLVNNTILGAGDPVGVYVDSRSKPGCASPSKPLCPGGTTSDRDYVRPWLTRLDWMPRIDLMINNIIAFPTASGYCGTTTVCITASNGSATAPLSTVIHKSDAARGIPQTVVDGNVYANGSGAAIATGLGSFTTHAAFGAAMASSPVSLPGVEARGKTGNGWVNADGSPTASLAARHGEAVAVPANARINQYVRAGTRAYGFLG